MVYGKIAKEQFSYTVDMACVYFLNDGYVYAAFNTVVPGGWASLTESAFVQYTREMYADTLTWGVGKPLIQIANTNRYGLVMLADAVTDDSPLKVATARAVKLAYDIAMSAYNAQSTTGAVGIAAYDAISLAKDSKINTTFNANGSITEQIRNRNNNTLLADRTTVFNANGSIGESVKLYNVETGAVSQQYTVATQFNADGTITTTTI